MCAACVSAVLMCREGEAVNVEHYIQDKSFRQRLILLSRRNSSIGEPHPLTASHPHGPTASHPTPSHPRSLITSHPQPLTPSLPHSPTPHSLTPSNPHSLTPSQPHPLMARQPHTPHPHTLTVSCMTFTPIHTSTQHAATH